MNGSDFIKDQIVGIEAAIDWLSPKRKLDRERWVAQTFIRNARLRFKVTDLSAGEDPPDILFRDARFEITEVMDPGRRRHDEYRGWLAKAHAATKPEDLFEMTDPQDASLQDIHQRCINAARAKGERLAPSVRRSLDLLIYVNLSNVWDIVNREFPSSSLKFSRM